MLLQVLFLTTSVSIHLRELNQANEKNFYTGYRSAENPKRSQWRLTGIQKHWHSTDWALESLLLQTQVIKITKLQTKCLCIVYQAPIEPAASMSSQPCATSLLGHHNSKPT